MEQLPLVLAPPPAPTLDNFVVGANGAALAALRELVADPSPCSRPLPAR
jgi:chromosomal replication initiation ATPase DnaA